ncbi:formylglycine-generating enzyme family protein [Luteimonas sp. RIT-PG2_3]
MRPPSMQLLSRGLPWSSLLLLGVLLLGVACSRAPDAGDAAAQGSEASPGDGNVTISGDDSLAGSLTWNAPQVLIAADAAPDALERADAALQDGRLDDDADAAIPLYLALRGHPAQAKAAEAGLQRALRQVIAAGNAALEDAEDDVASLRLARRHAAVARTLRPEAAEVEDLLQRVDHAERLWDLNREGERELLAGRLGENGGGALARFKDALVLQPRQARAAQGVAAVESAMIRRAEIAADRQEFVDAKRWLDHAAALRPDSSTVPDARDRIERQRTTRISRLRDQGVAVLGEYNGINTARKHLAELLRIARPGDLAAADLRERINLAVHYGLFGPGQVFTEAMKLGGRGPQMVVLPHGGFRMGSAAGEAGADQNEQPQHPIRFDRGLAMAIHEISVGEFRRFIEATGHQTRAVRRGYSMAYDERSGNFIRRSKVDWQSDYRGARAGEDMPVLHVSAKDAAAYADWLSAQTGAVYRLPSEAEFEYALRAGTTTRYPWPGDVPPLGAGNFTGALDRSPGGRNWTNAFAGHGDGYWGPSPVGRFDPNPWGVHDLAGNVSEWVADCWHDNYRRAPKDGSAWLNPGCRNQVIRGGSWASSPAQTRSAWRALAPVDTTNARIGFRVVRVL